MYNNIYNIINDITLYVGESKRINCPTCKGYKTFTISNVNGNLIWNCYKVSCSVSGSKRVGMSPDDIKNMQIRKDIVQQDFVLPDFIVPARDRDDLVSWSCDWGLDYTKLKLMYDAKEKRVVFPIVHNNKIVDATGRALTKRLPKWKRYGSSSLPYTCGQGNVAVVVEDCVSAAVVGGEKFVGVALLGTSLLESHKRYLTQFSSTIVALDPDALPKTISIAKQLRGHVPDIKVLRLEEDLKYSNETDMKKLGDML
tara:strand:+ start:1549 stop:2313 length:765 start_codon:yes stop_codon:yes gene_type:complete